MRMIEGRVLPNFRGSLQIYTLLFGMVATGCRPTGAPSSDEPLITVAACHERVWNEAWSEDDACTTCVAQHVSCAESQDPQCVERCESCLGPEACVFPENLKVAADHLAKSRMRPSAFWAFQGEGTRDVSIAGDFFQLVLDHPDPSILEPEDRRETAIHNEHGRLWAKPFEDGCSHVSVDARWAYRVCQARVEVFEASNGFKVMDWPLPVAANTLVTGPNDNGVQLDVRGALWRVAQADGIHHYGLDGVLQATTGEAEFAMQSTELAKSDAFAGLPDKPADARFDTAWLLPRQRDGLEVTLLTQRIKPPQFSARVQVSPEGYTTSSERHGSVLWVSPTLEGDAVWLASNDGLVKRWNFADGTSIRPEIPPNFRMRGRAGVGGSLVLVESRWEPEQRKWAPGNRVMVWTEGASKTVTFEKPVREAALPADDVLVAVYEDATVWWSISEARELRRELGPGNLSPDGRAVAFYPYNESFFGPFEFTEARVMETAGDADFRTQRRVAGCMFTPSSRHVSCVELGESSDTTEIPIYEIKTGEISGKIPVPNGPYFVALSEGAKHVALASTMPRHEQSILTLDGQQTALPSGQQVLTFLEDGRAVVRDGEWLRVVELTAK